MWYMLSTSSNPDRTRVFMDDASNSSDRASTVGFACRYVVISWNFNICPTPQIKKTKASNQKKNHWIIVHLSFKFESSKFLSYWNSDNILKSDNVMSWLINSHIVLPVWLKNEHARLISLIINHFMIIFRFWVSGVGCWSVDLFITACHIE